ncbi:conserved membrane hypothetical protein [Nostocoides australiense Ben110]|uniref:Sap, sulfolipid-1-addressing protein n=1 Tax=Nostocoides australiense Ben110 TaxID=1193182 RepID=W6JX15_9MICO|nr:GAP family protein [Tetrasphaera australiensis]CCH73180.1 conserved membrane hypothetical protein [Tetrasphaera australiensis Ben110]
MTLAVVAGLIGLALVDSTSLGTLVMPVWMIAHPRLRPSRVVLYLATIALFYWALGLALLLGASALTARWEEIGASRTTSWVQLVIGVGMLVASFWPDTPWARRRARERASGGREAGWRGRVTGADARASTVVTVALLAGLVEAASMVPYLGAIGLLSTSGLTAPASGAVLAVYVAVMCLPALVLLGLRLGLAERVTPLLTRLESWLTTHTGGAIWWVVGILGFFLAADAVTRLGLWGPGS